MTLLAETAEDALLTFAEVRDPLLTEPMRVVTDLLAYQWRGVQWEPVMFDFVATQDDDRPPEARITLPAIDQRIAQGLIALPGTAQISLWVLTAGDFDLSADPRVPLGEPVPLRSFLNLDLVDVRGDVFSASGALRLRDYTQESWPGVRATQSRCPGLFA